MIHVALTERQMNVAVREAAGGAAAEADAVERAICDRRAVRAFLPRPVSRALLEDVLRVAAASPSNSNTQPWRVIAVAGGARDALVRDLLDAHATAPDAHAAEHPPYAGMSAAHEGRRRAFGAGFYGHLGISRDDHAARRGRLALNLRFFDAPVGLVIALDRSLGPAAWLDLGLFLQTLMLAAHARGLGTCAQISLAAYHRVMRRHLPLAEGEVVACGMSLGYPDPAATVNRFRTDREPVQVFATLLGFDDA